LVEAFDVLAASIGAEAGAAGLSVTVESGRADGFGTTDVATLDVSISGDGPAVRVWDERGGDVWIELPAEDVTAAWWRQGRKEASLVEVVIALAEGRYTVESGIVSVSPRNRRPLTLRSQM
jgi:hypothetical protein